MKSTEHKQIVGILGGGQLAMMMVEAAQMLGIKTQILNTPEEMNAVDLVTFENEFFSDAFAIAARAKPNNFFCPTLSVVERLRNKLTQKKIFADLGLPSAPFVEAEPNASLAEFIASALKTLGPDVVWKWSLGGYDGKGVLVGGTPTEAYSFLSGAGRNFYAEQKIFYRSELAMISVRERSGKIIHYPLVRSRQLHGVCYEVSGPAIKLGFDPRLEESAIEMAAKLGAELDIQGAFAVEYFEHDKGLLINEMAPRVHNSGHFSQDLGAQFPSQFENHMRAVTGQPLREVKMTDGFFGMINLVGAKNAPSFEPQIPKNFASLGALHDYQKKPLRSLRKMGHINVTAANAMELEKKLNAIKIELIKEPRFLNEKE